MLGYDIAYYFSCFLIMIIFIVIAIIVGKKDTHG